MRNTIDGMFISEGTFHKTASARWLRCLPKDQKVMSSNPNCMKLNGVILDLKIYVMKKTYMDITCTLYAYKMIKID